jgi:uracil-DNA glycosylase
MDIAFIGVKQSWIDFIKLFTHYKYYEEQILKIPEETLNTLFQAFKYFELNETKVIIIGQDRYPTPGMANGLAFGVSSTYPGPLPPSMINIQKCLEPITTNLDTSLVPWAEQGVLLLNTYLTTTKDKYWLMFIREFLIRLQPLLNNIPIFLWGTHAKKLAPCCTNFNIMYFGHPSPLNRANLTDSPAHFKNCPHFEKTKHLITW